MIKITQKGNTVGFNVFPGERDKKVPALIIMVREQQRKGATGYKLD